MVAQNSVATNKPVALAIPIKLKFRSTGFCEGRKTGEPRKRKPSEQGQEPTTIVNPHMTVALGIEPGSHWWAEMSSHQCAIPSSSLVWYLLY